MRLRSLFRTRRTAIAPTSTKYLRHMSSMPPVVRTTLAPDDRIFWILSFVMSDSLQTQINLFFIPPVWTAGAGGEAGNRIKTHQCPAQRRDETARLPEADSRTWTVYNFSHAYHCGHYLFSITANVNGMRRKMGTTRKVVWTLPLPDLVQFLRVVDDDLDAHLHLGLLQAEVQAGNLGVCNTLDHSFAWTEQRVNPQSSSVRSGLSTHHLQTALISLSGNKRSDTVEERRVCDL